MSKIIRRYRPRKDKKPVQRIWQECGWISQEKHELEAQALLIKASDAWVMELNGEAECLVLSTDGIFHHTGTPLKLSAITGVTTSRVARNLSAASKTLARCLTEQAEAGKAVSGLGIFEQGFYNRLGYGNGTYEHLIRFDPAWIKNLGKPRTPVRLSLDDFSEIHQTRLDRRKAHGATDLLPPEITQADMLFSKKIFGLGYRENGKLTHCIIARGDGEFGPYHVEQIIYSSIHHFRELMALIRGLGDQVRQVRFREPRGIQIQSLLKKPFQLYTVTQQAKYQARSSAMAYWQLRILNLPECIAALSLDKNLEFNLTLSDPIEKYIDEKFSWRGCGGDYTVSLGGSSRAVPGHKDGLPVLYCSINDFTRFWMGAASAEVLNGLESFNGPEELIHALDQVMNFPLPAPDWDY
ncbi:MAG: GNAT family N-acetyltransferase [Spirochaetia bacterium]